MSQILTPDRGYVPISDIQVGDDVLAFDMVTGEKITNQVLEKQLWTNSPETPFFNGEFYLINEIWKCYCEQSIWRNDNQVVHINELQVGDIVFNGSDEDITVTSIEKITDSEWYRFEISGDHSYIVDNLTLHNASRFWVGNGATWDNSTTTNWAATSGGAGGQSVPVAADTVTIDASSGTGTITPNYNMTVTSITCGAMGMTLDFSANNNSPTMSTFSGTGTGTRTINMGSGTWTLTGSNTSIWDITTATNLTLNSNTSTINATYSGSTNTRTFVGSTSVNNLKISAGSDTVTFSTGGFTILGNLDYTGFTGIMGFGNPLNVRGNVTFGVNSSTSPSTNALTFTGTSGTQVFTSNGVQFNRPVTINTTAGVTVQLGSNLDMSGAGARTLTLTQGIFDANNFNVICAAFSSSNSNIRTLTMGSGTWTLTGSGATIWTTATTTNLTFNANTSTIVCNYSGSTGTRTFTGNSAAPINNINITAGSDTFTMSGATVNGNVSYSGFSGTASIASNTFKGNLTLGTGMTTTSSASVASFTGSGTQNITSNSVSLDCPITINATGSIVLLDNFTTGSSRTTTLTTGTINANGFNLTTGLFSSSNSNTRSILMGSGTWTLTGIGTVWTTATSTNLTLTPSTSTIVINDTSITSKTFTGGGLTFGNITFSGDNIIVVNNNTFTNFRVQNAGLTTGLLLTSGSTQTVSMFTTNGSAGSLAKLLSTSAGTLATLSKSSGIVGVDYMSIKDSTATGGATWYAGANSTNVSGNTGWVFSAAPSGGTTIGNNMANIISNIIII